jgi:sialate O-acetylesterase
MVLRLHSLFSDGVILQAGAAVPVRGQGESKQGVSIELAGQTHRTVCDEAGNWRIVLDPVEVGGPHLLRVRSQDKAIEREVWFGDVWLASGQSNMFWPLEQSLNGEEEIAACADPLLRFFIVPERVATTPQDETEGAWAQAQPATARRFSAIAFYFGQILRRTQSRPIGILQAAIGGTVISCWKSKATLEADPYTVEYRKAHQNALATYDSRVAEWKSRGETGPTPPPPERLLLSGYYNGMIVPLEDFPVKGVIWYQGEGNNKNSGNYEKELTDLIVEWREKRKQPELPFLFIQLPGFDGEAWVGHNWPYLRDAQLNTWRHVAHTGMVVAIDVGEPKNIHPLDKKPVGERLARLARHLVYGEKEVVPSGPLFRAATTEAGQIRLSFDYADGGLVTKDGSRSVAGFQVASKDGVYRKAEAFIDGNEIVIPFSPDSAPFFVRYAWSGVPETNLLNRDGLPAVPFRTDTQPFVAQ